jgi:hypothetical protein
MDEPLLRDLATRFLLPFFSGADLLPESEASARRHQRVAFRDPCSISFKARRADTYRLILHRSQSFDTLGSGRVTEKRVVEAFIDVVQRIEGGLGTEYKEDLLAAFQRRVVVAAIAPLNGKVAVLKALDQLSLWASRLYEGKPIAAAFGFQPNAQADSVLLEDMCQQDFCAVLSNGFDTLICFDRDGRFATHDSLDSPDTSPSFAPNRQASIAAWTVDGKIALVLNRLGEILIFKDTQLVFARRSGTWHFLTHEPVLSQMGNIGLPEVRKAVYESCLDASFARTGACLGIVKSSQSTRWKELAPSQDDHLAEARSVKARTLFRAVSDLPFQSLDRRFRQELLAIDGAAILDHRGTILTVGAILQIGGGSAGGGRLAAAKALSALGVGIKVSQDGSITGFHSGKDEPSFIVM